MGRDSVPSSFRPSPSKRTRVSRSPNAQRFRALRVATVWQTEGLVAGDAWSDFLPDSKIIEADWTDKLGCGNYNTVTKKCSGQNY